MLEYTTLHTPQLKGIIERILVIIKEGALDMLLNTKLNNKAHKMVWTEAVNTCKHVINSMANTGSTESPFENFYGEKPKIISLF